jgi:hypothetical protein
MFDRIRGSDRRDLLEMVALFFLFCSVYMLTYSGRLMFNDELQMLDTAGSIVEFCDTKYDVAMWSVWTGYALGQDDTIVSLIGYPLSRDCSASTPLCPSRLS